MKREETDPPRFNPPHLIQEVIEVEDDQEEDECTKLTLTQFGPSPQMMLDANDTEVRSVSSCVVDTIEETSIMDAIKVEEPVPRFVVTTMIPTTIEISDDEEEDSAQVVPDGVVVLLDDAPPGSAQRLGSDAIEGLGNGKRPGSLGVCWVFCNVYLLLIPSH